MNTVEPAFSGSLSPYGTAAASMSRESVRASLVPCIALLRLDRLLVAAERGLQRVPRERRALHARGELAHAREHGQLAELRRRVLLAAVRRRGHERVEALEQ